MSSHGQLSLSVFDREGVCRIERHEAARVVLEHHYSGRFPTAALFCYGMFSSGLLAGVCVFGVPASPWVSVSISGKANSVLELQRLALVENTKNTASHFVSRALRLLAVEYQGLVVSYADTAQGHHGGVYQALGFHYAGVSKERTDISAGGNHPRHHHGDRSLRVSRSPKHRYWVSVPRHKHDSQSLWPSLPYPKPGTKTQGEKP